MKGKVYLVGAGPGDPGLITLKAVECLKRADTIIYDYLCNPALLKHGRENAEFICGDKKGTRHADGSIINQEVINSLLIKKAKAGKTVVRLKGGDPFIFGRGGEEAEICVRNKIVFEIVPGVTAASGAAYAGIPLTHREFASSVSLITGHEYPQKAQSSIDWRNISRSGTLVFYMGVENLSSIVKKIVRSGRDEKTPAAVIERVTLGSQSAAVGTLADIAVKASRKGILAPALIIVGEVVKLREKLNWFEKKPLFGKTILVTRAALQAGQLSQKLLDLGANVIEFPTIKIAPLTDYSKVDRAASGLKNFDWVIFTSANGVEYFFSRLRRKKLDSRVFHNIKLAAIGPGTEDRLKNFGIQADYIPLEYRAEGIIESFPGPIMNKRILIPRAAKARDVLKKELSKRGARVSVLPVYKTVNPFQNSFIIKQMLKNGKIDIVTFTSSSAVLNFLKIINKKYLEKVNIASIGPVTSEVIKNKGLKVRFSANRSTLDGLVRALI